MQWQFIKLRAKYGWEGEAKFYALQNIIALNDIQIDINDHDLIQSTAKQLEYTIDELKDYIQFLSTECMLIIFHDTKFTTETLSVNLKNYLKTVTPDRLLPLETRRKNFQNLLRLYLDEYGKDMLNDFYIYWIEHNSKTNMMRFEEQKYFQVPNRLATWRNRNKTKYNNDKMVY